MSSHMWMTTLRGKQKEILSNNASAHQDMYIFHHVDDYREKLVTIFKWY